MQSNDDPETAALRWFSPAHNTGSLKLTSTISSRMLFEGGYSGNLEHHKQLPGGRRVSAILDGMQGIAIGRQPGWTQDRRDVPDDTEPGVTPCRPRSHVTGTHNFNVGFSTWGDWHTLDANGDLTQQHAATSTSGRFTVPDTVVIRNTPLKYGERLNRDFGVYVQDSWRLDRLSINAGIRWENIKAQVLASESPAGWFVPARSFGEIENLPNWKDWAPRFSAVYDLFGNGRTALKYSLNRYNQIRTIGIAANYNAFLSQTATLPWRDVNGDDIAQGERGCADTRSSAARSTTGVSRRTLESPP